MEQYAYIRVSTKEQNIDRQLLALEQYHIPAKNIYCDYQSGKDFDRPAYKRMLKKLRPSDVLIIKSIDRLGRNYNDILVLMLSLAVMIPLCHADMKLPGYLSWNVPFDGADNRPITEGISSYIHALPAL